ncbi:MAG: phosphate acyltransferase PlsX [Acidobacteriota bacterium]
MRIAVDAMGGDHAPKAPVEGALLARPQCSADLVLIGNMEQIEEQLGHEASSIEVVHAPETIGMEEAGPMAIRKKRDASLSVAMRLLAEGGVDAVVSAGNSAAIVAAAKHFIGLIPGLRRPAIAVALPTLMGRTLLLDAGAHAEADSIHLAQSAALAHAYLETTEGLSRPRIGLLNIGHEPTKGLKVIRKAHALLRWSSLNFIGNVEPQDLFHDRTDASVCDGFLGNLMLKMYEGVSETLLRFLEAQMADHEARDAVRAALLRYKSAFLYESVGGAPLLGTLKPVIVAHGRSPGSAIANAILRANRLAEENVYGRMAEETERGGVLTELKHYNALFMIESLKDRWGFTQK